MQTNTSRAEIRHFHLFCGLGGGAKGFNKGHARVGNVEADFRCIGGIDVEPAAIRDFDKLADVAGTVIDLFTREQYTAFHGHEPPAGWREATTADIHKAAHNQKPHIIFLSAPCKGFSGLLSETRSKTDKYQALNGLTLRGVWLALEAWKNDPVELFVFENVPRIANRGRYLLDQIIALFRSYGYAVAETTHDCGELGSLAQSRKRFLLVARHMEKVPPFLYEPEKRSLRAVGDILGRMPLPGIGSPMHRIPSLQWKTWVRLAFVEAGSDWRSLNKLRVVDGKLADYLLVPDMHNGMLGVNDWQQPAGTVTSRGRPNNGNFAVADPRVESDRHGPLGVVDWENNVRTIQAESFPTNGNFSVADPRYKNKGEYNQYGVLAWDKPCDTVTTQRSPGQGRFAVADPRGGENPFRKFHICKWDGNTPTVIGGHGLSNGAFGVADPRWREGADNYLTGGHYGVVPWDTHAGAVSASACQDNGRWSVADPRMPEQAEKLVAFIRAIDGTWHRPFTTLELAALQSLLEPEEFFELDGLSDSAWRERIGNAVPPDAAAAIASVMGTTLLLAWAGETFVLSNTPIWVRPIAIGLSVQQGETS